MTNINQRWIDGRKNVINLDFSIFYSTSIPQTIKNLGGNMTEVNCSITKCKSNVDEKCTKEQIEINKLGCKSVKTF